MRIESLSSQADRSGRHTVRLSDGTALRLYRQTVEDFGLYAGLELTDAQMRALRKAAGEMSAKMRAVRIVAASNVSRSDLEQRLIRKGESASHAKEAVQWMAEMSLVDDSRTAAQIVDSCIRKGYGRARAKQALYEKQIPRDLWEAALANYPDQTEPISRFLREKLRGDWDEKDLKRAVDALLRRGHSYGVIRSVLASMDVDSDDIQEEG